MRYLEGDFCLRKAKVPYLAKVELFDELDCAAEKFVAVATQSGKVEDAQVVARFQIDDRPVLVEAEHVLCFVSQLALKLVKVPVNVVDKRCGCGSVPAQDAKVLLCLDDPHSYVPPENENAPLKKGSWYWVMNMIYV